MNVITAIATTAGTKYADDTICQSLNGRAAALRLLDHAHDLRQQRLATRRAPLA